MKHLEKSSGSGTANEPNYQLADELHKQFLKAIFGAVI